MHSRLLLALGSQRPQCTVTPATGFSLRSGTRRHIARPLSGVRRPASACVSARLWRQTPPAPRTFVRRMLEPRTTLLSTPCSKWFDKPCGRQAPRQTYRAKRSRARAERWGDCTAAAGLTRSLRWSTENHPPFSYLVTLVDDQCVHFIMNTVFVSSMMNTVATQQTTCGPLTNIRPHF